MIKKTMKKIQMKTNKKLVDKLLLASSLGVSNVILAPIAFAAEPTAQTFTDYVLKQFVSPIFGLVVVVIIIKLFTNQDWMKAVFMFIAGGLVYLFIRDPQAFLEVVSNISKKFGF